MTELHQTWDLDSIFPGGSDSPALERELAALQAEIPALEQRLRQQGVPNSPAAAAGLAALVDELQATGARLNEAGAFVHCLLAANTRDEKARQQSGRVAQIGAGHRTLYTLLNRALLLMPEEVWNAFLADARIAPIAFQITERRRLAAEALPTEQETLINQLSVNGYGGWNDLYSTMVGHMTVGFTDESGRTSRLSMGQAQNKWETSASRDARQRLFADWDALWQEQSPLCAGILGHLSGFRLAVYRARGWDSVLKEPLNRNRMSAATLEAMWGVIDANKQHLVAFLQRKARLLGLDALAWYDLWAPLGEEAPKLSYDEGAAFVVDNFRRFSPHLADFAQQALAKRWVEAENRPGKAAGAFSTAFPVHNQTRVFMTYEGNASTLAHELGHSYHSYVCTDLPPLAKYYGNMSVAETASTFAENIVSDAAIKAADDDAARISLLLERITGAVNYFMNIHSRFVFEQAFYAERRQGPVPAERCNQLMQEAQQQCYRGALASYDPRFWAWKQHFYNTGSPFYNFPYTFGYMFSAGVYRRALEEGPKFAPKYVELLRDTGRMTVEDLARRHLGADLTRPEFWQGAADLAVADVKEFLRLTESRV